MVMVAPALPTMARFHGDDVPMQVRLALTAPAIAIAVLAVPVREMIDRLSNRHAIGYAAVAFGGLGVSGAVWKEVVPLIASRVLFGVAAAFVICGVSALVGEIFSAERRIGYLGVQNGTNFALGILVMLSAGSFADFGWRLAFPPFLLALPAAWLVLRFVPRDIAADALTGSAASDAIPWTAIALPLALAGIVMIFFNLGPTQSPFTVAGRHRGSTFEIALAACSTTVAGFPVALVYGRLARAFGPSLLFLAGFTLTGVGLIVRGAATSLSALIADMMISGAEFGVIMPSLGALLIELASPSQRGQISEAMLSAVFLAQFASALFSQPLVDSFGIGRAFLIFGVLATVVGAANFTVLQLQPLTRKAQ